MADNTDFITKPTRDAETLSYSHIFKLSIKAGLALLLIVTVCMYSIPEIVISIALAVNHPEIPIQDKLNVILQLLKIKEPLYTMSGMALAYYFGQQKQTQAKV